MPNPSRSHAACLSHLAVETGVEQSVGIVIPRFQRSDSALGLPVFLAVSFLAAEYLFLRQNKSAADFSLRWAGAFPSTAT
jgi:hypothetical protein